MSNTDTAEIPAGLLDLFLCTTVDERGIYHASAYRNGIGGELVCEGRGATEGGAREARVDAYYVAELHQFNPAYLPVIWTTTGR